MNVAERPMQAIEVVRIKFDHLINQQIEEINKIKSKKKADESNNK